MMKKLLGKSMLGLGFCFTGSNVFAQTAVEINYKEALQEFKEENYSKSIKLLENAVGLQLGHALNGGGQRKAFACDSKALRELLNLL